MDAFFEGLRVSTSSRANRRPGGRVPARVRGDPYERGALKPAPVRATTAEDVAECVGPGNPSRPGRTSCGLRRWLAAMGDGCGQSCSPRAVVPEVAGVTETSWDDRPLDREEVPAKSHRCAIGTFSVRRWVATAGGGSPSSSAGPPRAVSYIRAAHRAGGPAPSAPRHRSTGCGRWVAPGWWLVVREHVLYGHNATPLPAGHRRGPSNGSPQR